MSEDDMIRQLESSAESGLPDPTTPKSCDLYNHTSGQWSRPFDRHYRISTPPLPLSTDASDCSFLLSFAGRQEEGPETYLVPRRSLFDFWMSFRSQQSKAKSNFREILGRQVSSTKGMMCCQIWKKRTKGGSCLPEYFINSSSGIELWSGCFRRVENRLNEFDCSIVAFKEMVL
ncbi:hypothetical protein CEXT_179711 [Caerostris extrusa]|uniref:Uncharacterized protein n=1 Tax=Caerostris extrusa TaxID=172846 RepID=A0AAV4WBH3_CAEEX|nr:hypothetical protein CEXT_179711 [Caerostris extrusa]